MGGGRREVAGYPDAYYVEPAIVRMPGQTELVRRETFAPILYVMSYTDLEEAIAVHNGVPQGLSSSIFTGDQREAERFLSADGSDCGIVNVNIGTSGRRDRRRVRRREVDRWRPRVRLGRLARLHAPGDQHRQLLGRAAAGPGRGVWLRSVPSADAPEVLVKAVWRRPRHRSRRSSSTSARAWLRSAAEALATSSSISRSATAPG